MDQKILNMLLLIFTEILRIGKLSFPNFNKIYNQKWYTFASAVFIGYIFNSRNQRIIWLSYWQEFSLQHSKKNKPTANALPSSFVGHVKTGKGSSQLASGPYCPPQNTVTMHCKPWTSPCWSKSHFSSPDRLVDEECFLN